MEVARNIRNVGIAPVGFLANRRSGTCRVSLNGKLENAGQFHKFRIGQESPPALHRLHGKHRSVHASVDS
jgi:hypothetical protein